MNVTFKFLELKQMQWSLFTKKSHPTSSSQNLKSESWEHRRQHQVSIFFYIKRQVWIRWKNRSFDFKISALERTLLLQTFCAFDCSRTACQLRKRKRKLVVLWHVYQAISKESSPTAQNDSFEHPPAFRFRQPLIEQRRPKLWNFALTKWYRSTIVSTYNSLRNFPNLTFERWQTRILKTRTGFVP